MTGLGQRLRDPKSLMVGGKPRGNIPGSDCGRVCRSGAEVSSTRWQSSWVNLRRSVRVGAWNDLSERVITCLCYHLSSSVWTSALQHSLRFGDRIVVRSWRVVTPTIGLVAPMVTVPKCPRLISAPGEIHFQSWGISMHRLELIGMFMRHVLVPMGLEL